MESLGRRGMDFPRREKGNDIHRYKKNKQIWGIGNECESDSKSCVIARVIRFVVCTSNLALSLHSRMDFSTHGNKTTIA